MQTKQSAAAAAKTTQIKKVIETATANPAAQPPQTTTARSPKPWFKWTTNRHAIACCKQWAMNGAFYGSFVGLWIGYDQSSNWIMAASLAWWVIGIRLAWSLARHQAALEEAWENKKADR